MKAYLRNLFITLILAIQITAVYSQSQTDYTKKIAPELLKKDFKTLRDSLQSLHAGLYRYKSEAEMNEMFDRCYQKLDYPMTEIDFFAIVSGLASSIEDGHTECFLPQDMIQAIIANVKVFPIQPKYIGDKAYVPCDTKEFPAGTEIVKIDDQPVNEIRTSLFRLLSSDGSIETEKYVKINDGHDPFSYLYFVVYGEKVDFRITYKTTSGKLAEKQLPAEYFPRMECGPVRTSINQYLSLEYRSKGVAVMTLKTFANEYLERTKENFEKFLAASFKELRDKKINKLIIDLRENGGGEDTNGLLLYRYLSDKPFQYYSSLNTTKHTIIDHPNLAVQQPEDNNFTGKVEFLIGGKSFSGAAEFSSIARTNSRGLFIGEETAGGYYGNSSGSKFALILPNTRIRVNIPLTKYVMAVKKVKYKDRGVLPDYTIIPTINDYLQHMDVQMDYALKLLK
ncbi:MAG: Peptidase family [Mucilaginibacter sp.]|nr:Peptidase family [Mucilaginibacter sp.]